MSFLEHSKGAYKATRDLDRLCTSAQSPAQLDHEWTTSQEGQPTDRRCTTTATKSKRVSCGVEDAPNRRYKQRDQYKGAADTTSKQKASRSTHKGCRTSDLVTSSSCAAERLKHHKRTYLYKREVSAVRACELWKAQHFPSNSSVSVTHLRLSHNWMLPRQRLLQNANLSCSSWWRSACCDFINESVPTLTLCVRKKCSKRWRDFKYFWHMSRRRALGDGYAPSNQTVLNGRAIQRGHGQLVPWSAVLCSV